MKKLLGLSLLVGMLLISGCAITHEYGPYMGKVVEKETGTPIEGAVVFVEFYTGVGNIGGMSSHYVDALETLTDANGEFLVPLHRVTTFRILHGWIEEAYAIIFKPGYGAFPHYQGTTLTHPNGTLPANESVVIELPKLKTRQERGRNADFSFDRSSVPYEKYKLMFGAVNEERNLIGSEPFPDPRQFKWSK